MMSICFTGRISRLINCLSGLDDAVNIGISENAQVQAKYNVIYKELIKNFDADELEYNILFKYKFYDLLKEIDLGEDIIQTWLEPFNTAIIDNLNLKSLSDNVIKKIVKTVSPNYLIRFIKEYVNNREEQIKYIRIALDINYDEVETLSEHIMIKYYNTDKLLIYGEEQDMINYILEPSYKYIDEYLEYNDITVDDIYKLKTIEKNILLQFVNEYLKYDKNYYEFRSIVLL